MYRLSLRLRGQARSHIWHFIYLGIFTNPGFRPNTSTPWPVDCPVVTWLIQPGPLGLGIAADAGGSGGCTGVIQAKAPAAKLTQI